ncbi:2-oxoacid:ferredoxin oxidoreductase subunit gamma [Candidatus Bathyarchaeota archaeon]|nr:2-oxoacid:ferredoxin oxidoreductase subunit gamma [Candidatus Bathyarchaeota archaeon]
MKQNILIGGTGGQGIVAAGEFLSQALFMKDYEVMFGRSYGSEARGGSCRSEVIVSDNQINDLQFEESDIFICLSLPAFKKYIKKARSGSIVITDSMVINRVEEKIRDDIELFPVPARDIALRLGNQIVANMVMLGALAKRSEIVRLELLKDAIKENMREDMQEINLRALEEGYTHI